MKVLIRNKEKHILPAAIDWNYRKDIFSKVSSIINLFQEQGIYLPSHIKEQSSMM